MAYETRFAILVAMDFIFQIILSIHNKPLNIVIDEAGLDNAIGVELVTIVTDKDNVEHIYNVEPLDVVKREGNLYTFHVTHAINNAGSFKIAYRIFPKNDLLPHRQDFCYVKWLELPVGM